MITEQQKEELSTRFLIHVNNVIENDTLSITQKANEITRHSMAFTTTALTLSSLNKAACHE
jgi:hypothetical protein